MGHSALSVIFVILFAVAGSVLGCSHQGAIDVYIVENGGSEVVRAGILTFVKNDADTLHLRGRHDRRKRRGWIPSQPEPSIPYLLLHRRRRGAPDKVRHIGLCSYIE